MLLVAMITAVNALIKFVTRTCLFLALRSFELRFELNGFDVLRFYLFGLTHRVLNVCKHFEFRYSLVSILDAFVSCVLFRKRLVCRYCCNL